jgi:hypothetical protein
VRPFLSPLVFSADVVRNDGSCSGYAADWLFARCKSGRLALCSVQIGWLFTSRGVEIVFVIVEGALLVLFPLTTNHYLEGLTWSLEWHDHGNVVPARRTEVLNRLARKGFVRHGANIGRGITRAHSERSMSPAHMPRRGLRAAVPLIACFWIKHQRAALSTRMTVVVDPINPRSVK